MVDDNEQTDADAGKTPPAKPNVVGKILGWLLPAVLAAAAAFGGASLGSAATGDDTSVQKASAGDAPGPTVNLAPFVLAVPDAEGKRHTLKMSIAVELEVDANESEFVRFESRVRDAVITALRSRLAEEIGDGEAQEKLRVELLAKIHELGARQATRIWFTDFVMQ